MSVRRFNSVYNEVVLRIPMRGYEHVSLDLSLPDLELRIPMRGYEIKLQEKLIIYQCVLRIPMRGYERF